MSDPQRVSREKLAKLVTPEFLSKLATFAHIVTDEMASFAENNCTKEHEAELFFGMLPVFLFCVHELAQEEIHETDVDEVMHGKVSEMRVLVAQIQDDDLQMGHA